MITMKELMPRPIKTPDEHKLNLLKLLGKLNLFREAYGKPLQVTSGYRTLEHHLEIYRLKGITDPKKIPMQSNHLKGLAADLVPVEDDIEHLQRWVLNNIPLMTEIGLWFERFDYSPEWLHAQIVAPKSGNRFFLP